MSLFYLGQDHIAIKELSALETGLEAENTAESRIGASKAQSEPTVTKIDQHGNSLPHIYFMEQLRSVIEKR
jgi:hypothetical protein